MSDEKTPAPDLSSGRRRRAPTIDLKATEVASEPQEGAAEASPQSEEARVPPDESSASEETSRRGLTGLLPSWPAVVGAAVGGALVLAGIWLGRLILPQPQNAQEQISQGQISQESADRLARLESRIRAISERPAQAADSKAIDDLAARLGKIEHALAEQGAPAAAAPDPAIARRLEAAEAAAKSLAESLAKLDRRADENTALARDARSRAESAASRAEAVQTDAAKRESETGADRAMRLAIVALALRGAVERGEPFETELAAVKALAPDATMLAPLEAFAAKGVPSQQSLAGELSALASTLSKSIGETPAEGNFLERLQASAQRLVRIRPVSDAPGDDPRAVVARAEIKAGRGDVSGARAELTKLPEPMRASVEPWIKKAAAREAALAASRRIASLALDALGKPLP